MTCAKELMKVLDDPAASNHMMIIAGYNCTVTCFGQVCSSSKTVLFKALTIALGSPFFCRDQTVMHILLGGPVRMKTTCKTRLQIQV